MGKSADEVLNKWEIWQNKLKEKNLLTTDSKEVTNFVIDDILSDK